MKKEELARMLGDVEWEDFEAKKAKTATPKSCWETVSALSNTSGGWLVLGASKNGKPYEATGASNYQ